MDPGELGEFGLIDRIRRRLGEPSGSVCVGINDDAAVFALKSKGYGVLTTDVLVEKVHFDLAYTPIRSLGWKAMAVNLSDVAAMGAVPKYALISLALDSHWSLEDIDALYMGFSECASEYGCDIIGGDTSASRSGAFLSLALYGEIDRGAPILRSGARSGDLLCVTGTLGDAYIGRSVLSAGEEIEPFRKAVDKFLRPLPRVREALQLRENISLTAMIDISDGLASETGHICRQSGLGCRIDEAALPLTQEVRHWAAIHEQEVSSLAIQSGEEYELLFTVDSADRNTLEALSADIPVSIIGVMTDSAGGMVLCGEDGTRDILSGGWDHFKENETE